MTERWRRPGPLDVVSGGFTPAAWQAAHAGSSIVTREPTSRGADDIATRPSVPKIRTAVIV
jgi:hypothetical protein